MEYENKLAQAALRKQEQIAKAIEESDIKKKSYTNYIPATTTKTY